MKLPPRGFVLQLCRNVRPEKWVSGFVRRPIATAKCFKVWVAIEWAVWLLTENERINGEVLR